MKRELIKVFIGENFSKSLLLIVNLVLISGMSVSQYAQFTLLFSLVLLGSQLVCAATERLYIADYDNFRVYSKQALIGCMGICLIIFIIYLDGISTISEKVTVCIALVILSLYQFRRITYQQRQNYSLYLIADIFKNGGWLISILVLFYLNVEASAEIAILLLVVSAMIGFVFVPKIAHPIIEGGKAPSYQDVFRVVLKNSDVYIYTLIGAVLPYIPVLMAARTGQDSIIATYGSAMRYQAIVASFTQVLNVVYLPKLAAQVKNGQALGFLEASYRSIPKMSAGFLLVTVAVFIAIPYVDEGRYPNAPAIFALLAGCSWLSLIAVSSINYLLAKHVYRPILLIMIFGCCLIIIANIILKIYFPVVGIALASLFGYAVINGLLIAKARKIASGEMRSNDRKYQL